MITITELESIPLLGIIPSIIFLVCIIVKNILLLVATIITAGGVWVMTSVRYSLTEEITNLIECIMNIITLTGYRLFYGNKLMCMCKRKNNQWSNIKFCCCEYSSDTPKLITKIPPQYQTIKQPPPPQYHENEPSAPKPMSLV